MQLIQLLEVLQAETIPEESEVHRAVENLDLGALVALRDQAGRFFTLLNDEALLRLELKGLRLPAHLSGDLLDYRRACRWYVDAEDKTLHYSPASMPFTDPDAWTCEALVELEPMAAGPYEVFVTEGDGLTVVDGRYRCEPPSPTRTPRP